MNPETLQPNEALVPKDAQPEASHHLTEAEVRSVMAARREALTGLQANLGKKRYYQLEEKLGKEQAALDELLAWYSGAKRRTARYTFVLDPQYFEQKLM